VKIILKTAPGKLFSPKIDTTRQIPQTLYFSLTGVDALQGGGLRYV